MQASCHTLVHICPTDFYAVWCTVKRLPVSLNEFALQGVTRIAGANTIQYFHPLPESLEHLTFKSGFNKSLKGVTLLGSLQTLTLANALNFNQSLEGVTLPNSLQTLTFGREFNQSLEGVTLPGSLSTLTFGDLFDQSLEGVTLSNTFRTWHWARVTPPSNLQTLAFSGRFAWSLPSI